MPPAWARSAVLPVSRRPVTGPIGSCGDVIAGTVSGKVHYLVVGDLGSGGWKRSTLGTKNLKALELRQSGSASAIVAESHWLRFALR